MEDKKTLAFEFTVQEVNAIDDAIIWRIIECRKWIEDTKDQKNDLERQIYKNESETLRILEQIRNKLFFI